MNLIRFQNKLKSIKELDLDIGNEKICLKNVEKKEKCEIVKLDTKK
jgi:hypothetical protein